jgi:hypothetical protein
VQEPDDEQPVRGFELRRIDHRVRTAVARDVLGLHCLVERQHVWVAVATRLDDEGGHRREVTQH